MRVLTTHRKYRGQRMTIGWDEQGFPLIESPFFLLSENGQLMYGSRAGLTLLRGGGHLTLRDGRLWCGDTALIERFDPRAEEPFELPALAPANTALHVTPLYQGQFPQPLFHWFPKIAFLVMVRTQTIGKSPAADEAFALRHGITPSEMRVLLQLVSGRTPRDAAHAMGISVHTVRAHLAHIFSKLKVKPHPLH